MNRPARRGFTLVELLVVITIIVVLLALLAPALDKAIYQAELAVCGARLHAIGVGAHIYAIDSRRFYPHRHLAGGAELHKIVNATLGDPRPETQWDQRPVFRGYIDLKLFNDPLAGAVDLSVEGNKPNTQVFIPYILWFGWTYVGETHGLRKIGDRVRWKGFSSDVLVSDKDLVTQNGPPTSCAHPDGRGVTKNIRRQSEQGAGAEGVWAIYETSARWQGETTNERGTVDLNFLHSNGAVGRLGDVLWNDPRMEQMPTVPQAPNSTSGRVIYLPKPGAR